MVKNERGFTLIEALVSLVIVSIFTLVSFPFVVNLYDYIRLNQALTMIQADLHYVRDFNMMPLQDDQRMTLRIYHDQDRYVILANQEVRLERDLPQNVSMPSQNTVTNITFNARGNLGMGRTILITSSQHERRLVFSVGVGGFDVRR